MKQYLIAPSILSADFACLGEDIVKVLNSGAEMIHFDVMDNHYVPNLTVGPIVLKAIRNYGITAPINVHLMVKPVDRIIPDFIDSGATAIIFHPETSNHINQTLKVIKAYGCKAGLAFNPNTSLNCLNYVIDKLDIILIMLVNPGFSGQSLIPSTLKKLEAARYLIDKYNSNIRLEVDGGLNIDNISKVAKSGADTFVIGSSIFKQSDYKEIINEIHYKLGKINNNFKY